MNNKKAALSRHKLALAFAALTAGYQALADVPKSVESGSTTSFASIAAKPGAELLDPEQAFRPQIRLHDRTTLEVRFEVAPGYYLYRDRIRVDAEQKALPAGKNASRRPDTGAKPTKNRYALQLPPGRSVDDPTFGKVDIFDKSTTFTVDLTTTSGSSPIATGAGSTNKSGNAPKAGPSMPAVPASKLVVSSQGCAAAGVCFPAQRHEFPMPAFASNGKGSDGSGGGWLSPLASSSQGFGQTTPPATPPATSRAMAK